MLFSLALSVAILPILALILLTFILTCFDRYGWAALTMTGSIAIFASTQIAQDFVTRYSVAGVATMVVAYVVIGLVVMFLKWFLKIRQFGVWLANYVEEFNKYYKEPKSRKDISSTMLKGDEEFEDVDPTVMRRRLMFRDLLGVNHFRSAKEHLLDKDVSIDHAVSKATDTPENFIKAIHPKMKQHIGMLTAWTFEWPYVLLSLILKNFVFELVENIISLCSNTVNRISGSIVARLTKDVSL